MSHAILKLKASFYNDEHSSKSHELESKTTLTDDNYVESLKYWKSFQNEETPATCFHLALKQAAVLLKSENNKKHSIYQYFIRIHYSWPTSVLSVVYLLFTCILFQSVRLDIHLIT
ncbi:hypothetical protein T4D_15736 [Trichinella pseudospiralis]|uniref:Uncharacterized protein n=1 Tax=Trichinella pseudospiralis TaxID=6337 RepID=A0A0V1G4T2_TRIPS|nr:hypothetical protein T4D_15736 [Trichinella pseudospiralis]